MKHIIFCWSILSTFSLFSMENPKLTIRNALKQPVTVSYKKVLPGHVLCKQEIISVRHNVVKIPLPMTNALHIAVAGYVSQKIYVPEYGHQILIESREGHIVISQGEKTLGVLEPMERKP